MRQVGAVAVLGLAFKPDTDDMRDARRVRVIELLLDAGATVTAYEQWRERVVDAYVAQTTKFIERQVATGRSDVPDPAALARALILMNVSVATDEARRPEPFSAERLGRTIGRVWARSIYRNH